MTAGQQSVATVVSVNFADDILHQGLGIVTIGLGSALSCQGNGDASGDLSVAQCPGPRSPAGGRGRHPLDRARGEQRRSRCAHRPRTWKDPGPP